MKIEVKTRREAGSCNFCDNLFTDCGNPILSDYTHVFQISNEKRSGLLANICPSCMNQLRNHNVTLPPANPDIDQVFKEICQEIDAKKRLELDELFVEDELDESVEELKRRIAKLKEDWPYMTRGDSFAKLLDIVKDLIGEL